MAVARESIHVDADLGHEDFGCALVDPGNGIEALHRVREGRQDRRDTPTQRGHRLFEMVEMGQDLCREEGVMGAEVAGERLPQGRSLVRMRPRANSAKTAGSLVPCTRASSMARPEVPRTSLATVTNLMPASSSILWTRFASRVRSWMSDFR
jgi:hypothetical protein